MSLVEPPNTISDRTLITWSAYGLTAIAAALAVVLAVVRDAGQGWSVAVLLLALPMAVLVLVLLAPQFFEIRTRSGARAINFLLVAPVLGPVTFSLQTPLLHPEIGWTAAAVGALAGALVSFWPASRPEVSGRGAIGLFLALYGAGYAYGAPMLTNLTFDAATPRVFQAPVQDRNVTFGKGGRRYHVRIGPWGPMTHAVTADVRQRTYDALAPGAIACVTLHPGILGVAWYKVAVCGA